MKVDLNLTVPINNGGYKNHRDFVASKEERSTNPENNRLSKPFLSPANFPNISFKACDTFVLLNYADRLNCAYGNRPMIAQNELQKLFSKLAKRPNAQAAINLLQNYVRYMYRIEGEVFDLFLDADHKNKLNFVQILKEYVPSSLERLKEKQQSILTSTDTIIDMLSPKVKEQAKAVLEDTLIKTEDGTFTRKYPLDLINGIKGNPDDVKLLDNIYHAWYQLPRSSKDIDAFIVGYSKQSHDAIARRLLSSAAATIEHIKPQSKNGGDTMSNYLLVCAQLNNERSSMPLDEYIMLNPDIEIPKNLQIYMDSVIREIGIKNSLMSTKSWYPEAMKETILEESSGYVNLDTSKLILTKDQIRENNSAKRLKDKYNVK